MATTLAITLQDDGKIRVEGPIDDKLYCFGLLELAKDALRSHQANAARVQTASVIPSLKLAGG